jgi:hypothetical protein
MAEIRSFRDLNVYSNARDAARAIFEVSKTFPREERFSLTEDSPFVTRRKCNDC